MDFSIQHILTQIQSFQIGSVTFYTYGAIIGISIAVLIYFVVNRIPPFLVNSKHFIRMLLISLVASVIGGRIFYILLNWNRFSNDFLKMLMIYKGGIHLFGVLLFGALSLWIYWHFFWSPKSKTFSFADFTDITVTATALAQLIGRWANFINQELFGPPTSLPWGIYIPLEKRPVGYSDYDYFHPAFLYESTLNLLNFLILYKILQHKKANKTKSGIITGIYMINYGIIRIVVERFRIDTSTIIGPLKANDIFSVLLVLSGIIILNYSRIKHGFTRKEKQSN